MEVIRPVLFEHRSKLAVLDQSDEVKDEIELVDDVLAAPTRAMHINFEPTEEETKEDGKHMSSMALKN